MYPDWVSCKPMEKMVESEEIAYEISILSWAGIRLCSTLHGYYAGVSSDVGWIVYIESVVVSSSLNGKYRGCFTLRLDTWIL